MSFVLFVRESNFSKAGAFENRGCNVHKKASLIIIVVQNTRFLTENLILLICHEVNENIFKFLNEVIFPENVLKVALECLHVFKHTGNKNINNRKSN